MALDFPASPTEGQVFHNNFQGPIFVFRSGVWTRNAGTALPANKIINGNMQLSEQNGNTSGIVSGYYAADQWRVDVVGALNIYAYRIALSTLAPRGSRYSVFFNGDRNP